jgi:hypothetical protein
MVVERFNLLANSGNRKSRLRRTVLLILVLVLGPLLLE